MVSAFRLLVLGLFWLLAPACVLAQDAPPQLRGRTLDGRDFDLARLRGRVVMVVLWRTDCAVCLDKMPELRANALGWKAAPFDLLLVNLDAASTDAQTYDRLRRLAAAAEGPLYSFWRGDVEMPEAWRTPSRVPTTLVIDRDGRVAARHAGRVPAEAWDKVADLLP